MEIVKTFATVAVAAGVGAWVGEKAYGAIESKLPATVGTGARAGAKLGFQAGAAVITYGIVRSVL